jgi:hypothetical protein
LLNQAILCNRRSLRWAAQIARSAAKESMHAPHHVPRQGYTRMTRVNASNVTASGSLALLNPLDSPSNLPQCVALTHRITRQHICSRELRQPMGGLRAQVRVRSRYASARASACAVCQVARCAVVTLPHFPNSATLRLTRLIYQGLSPATLARLTRPHLRRWRFHTYHVLSAATTGILWPAALGPVWPVPAASTAGKFAQ